MRIDAYKQISQIYNTSKVNKTKPTTPVQTSDEVQISQAGRDFQIAKKAVADTTDVREDVVSSVKSSIEAGTYQVSSKDFANKLLQRYNELEL